MNWYFDELNVSGDMSCSDFEKDKEIACDGDKPCCAICKWNNKTTEQCLIGRDH